MEKNKECQFENTWTILKNKEKSKKEPDMASRNVGIIPTAYKSNIKFMGSMLSQQN